MPQRTLQDLQKCIQNAVLSEFISRPSFENVHRKAVTQKAYSYLRLGIALWPFYRGKIKLFVLINFRNYEGMTSLERKRSIKRGLFVG